MSTWVLLRGLTREARHWGDFADRFGRGLGDERVVCVDLPGSGSRHHERSPTNVAAMVVACRRALRSEGVAPPWRLFALSLGGMVAVSWATSHPQEVLGAVLVNTSLGDIAPWHRRLRPRQWRPLIGAILARDALAIERRVMAMTTHHPSVDPETLAARWAAIRREHPVTRANALRQLWAAARFRAPSLPPPVPLLLLASRADALVDVICSERLAAAWHADLAVHPTAGHDLPLDDPDWVVGTVARWLDRGGRASDVSPDA